MFSFTTLVVGAMLKPKHIVIVTSDDQGWIQAGCYGHPFLKTPHLDAMAKNGIRSNASMPMLRCVHQPVRASLPDAVTTVPVFLSMATILIWKRRHLFRLFEKRASPLGISVSGI
jgi:hypothetical protein